MILQINEGIDEPIYEQLRNQIVIGIANGQLLPNERLPSVRSLAADLGVNKITVNKVYTILCDEGYIMMDYRKKAMVADKMPNHTQFLERLRQKLLLMAAEARCGKLSQEDFVNLCLDSYEQAGTRKETI